MDVNSSVPCMSFACEDLAGMETFVHLVSSSSPVFWSIGEGYKGQGFVLEGNSFGGTIEFNVDLLEEAKMTFWAKSFNPGYPKITPHVYINNLEYDIKQIEEASNAYGFSRFESANLLAGQHTIEISFTSSQLYNYYIDEIEFWCK